MMTKDEMVQNFKKLEKMDKLEKLLNMLELLKDKHPICDRFFNLIVETGPEIDDGILHFIYSGLIEAGHKQLTIYNG